MNTNKTRLGDLFAELTAEEKEVNKTIAQIALMIRKSRKKMGITQAELAEKCGVSQPMVCQWESAESAFPAETLVKIAQALGLKLEITFKHMNEKASASSDNVLYLPNQNGDLLDSDDWRTAV